VTGFPEIFFDEGIYMRRAMHVLSGEGPQEGKFYDHPYFGQIFLGSILYLIGYPDSLHAAQDANSIKTLYEIPRIIMGLLAVFDTFLIYKIASKKYDSKIAVFASTLFAVMPITWITRRILLDSILLPFVLLSILFAIYSKESRNGNWLVFLSGVFLGLAIFTKIPAFTMIPVVAYLVYSQNKRKQSLFLLLIPALLLPMIWPAQSIVSGHFANWEKDVLWQSERQNPGIQKTILLFGAIDPVLLGLGLAGLAYAAIRKNMFVLLWTIPFIVFLSVVGYVQYFHWLMVIPAFCVAAALLIGNLGKTIKQEKLRTTIPIITIIAVASFGFASTVMLLGLNMTSNQFEAAAFAEKLATDHDSTILAGPHFSWIFKDVYDVKNIYPDYTTVLFRPLPQKFVLISDPHYHMDFGRGPELERIYNSTITIESFESEKSKYDVYQYPYSSLGYNYDAGKIEVRATKNLLN